MDTINNNIMKQCYKLLTDHDNFWIKRKRILDTKMIFDYLSKSSILNTGISTCVYSENTCTHAAIIKASGIFDSINITNFIF